MCLFKVVVVTRSGMFILYKVW